MAYKFFVNNTFNNGAQAMWKLVTSLVTAGWVVKADSDGTTYAAGGGQVTGGGTGAHGLDNASAWIRVQAPSVGASGQTREFTFQRGTADARYWRIKYSASAGFIIGAAAIVVTPTAADEVVMFSLGTDAAPAFTNWFPNTDFRWHVACGGGAESYSFYAFGMMVGTNSTANGMCLDVMASGSYSDLDIDPAVVYVSGSNGSGYEFGSSHVFSVADMNGLGNVTNPSLARAWLGPTSQAGIATAGTNNQRVAMATYSTNGMGAYGLGRCPWNNVEDMLPVWWMRSPSALPLPAGLKGRSTLFTLGSVMKPNMVTIDYARVKDFVSIGGPNGIAPITSTYIPWSGDVPEE